MPCFRVHCGRRLGCFSGGAIAGGGGGAASSGVSPPRHAADCLFVACVSGHSLDAVLSRRTSSYCSSNGVRALPPRPAQSYCPFSNRRLQQAPGVESWAHHELLFPPPPPLVVVRSPCQEHDPADAHPSAHKSVLESANPCTDSECASGCTWSTARATARLWDGRPPE